MQPKVLNSEKLKILKVKNLFVLNLNRKIPNRQGMNKTIEKKQQVIKQQAW